MRGRKKNLAGVSNTSIQRLAADRSKVRVIKATSEELDAHHARLNEIEKSSGSLPLWKVLAEK